jgi:hypothetical protein
MTGKIMPPFPLEVVVFAKVVISTGFSSIISGATG